MSKYSALQDFRTKLINDPTMWAQFRTNSAQMIKEAGLTPEEAKLLTEGPIEDLRNALDLGSTSFSAIVAQPQSLNDFYTSLLTDPAKWEKFRTQPQAVIKASGLSDADQDLVQNGPVEAVQAKVGGSMAPMLIIW